MHGTHDWPGIYTRLQGIIDDFHRHDRRLRLRIERELELLCRELDGIPADSPRHCDGWSCRIYQRQIERRQRLLSLLGSEGRA